MSLLRWSFTTRPLTEAEQTSYLAGSGLPAGIGYDPPKVVFEYLPPRGEPWVNIEGGAIVKDGVGAYHYESTETEAGPLVWRGVGKDNAGNVLVTTPLEELTIRGIALGGPGRPTVAELVAAVIEDGQLDASEPQVLRWLNTRHTQMCVRSRCFRRTIGLGNTVAGQASYALPPEVVEILQVTVGGFIYGHARHGDFAEGERGWIWLGGEGGIAGRDDDASGTQSLRLYPAPKSGLPPEPGAAISLYVVAYPPLLAAGADAAIKVPDDYVDALVSGAIATGLLRMESRPDLASSHEQLFDAGCAELARMTDRKFRGAGPAQIRVVGVNA